MFIQQNKIIIVDDVEGHLDILSKPFYEKGIGCKTFLYDPMYNNPLKNVRIAFFDININPSPGGTTAKRNNDLAIAIKQYIHFDNGPFALIFWTSNKDDIQDIKRFINERHNDCPRPFLVDFIDKDIFLNSAVDLPAVLTEKLENEILKNLFEFEKKSVSSASNTINQIYQIIPHTDAWGETEGFINNFTLIFSKIAISSSGFKLAKENPDLAINEALLPILSHHFLLSSRDSDNWKSSLANLKTANKESDIPQIPHFNNSILNTIFHIELNPHIKPIARGAVLDYRFCPQHFNWFNYIKQLKKESDLLYSKFIQFSTEISENEKEQFIGDSHWVAIEISPACDFSQDKPRNNKYLLGLLTPDISSTKLATNFSISVIKDLPVFYYNSKDCRLWINLNFSFSDFESNQQLGKPLFQLKKEIMDLIGNRYANHVSRIGITHF